MRKTCVAGLACLVALSGCTLGNGYQRPSVDLPPSKQVSDTVVKKKRQALAAWWQRFDDPTLTHLIGAALDRNLEIAKQAQVVLEARAALGLANAKLFPTVSAQASAARQYRSLAGAGAGGPGGGQRTSLRSPERSQTTFSVAGTLSYEFNIFGRLQYAQKSARAQLLSTVFTKDAIRLTVVADVVTTYMTLRALQRKVQATQRTIDTRNKAFELDQKRYEYGAINKLKLLQSRALLRSARSRLPPLKQQLAETRTALAILTGKTPRQIMRRADIPSGSFDDLEIPELPEAVPSLIVMRRADIRAAEATLIAADANVAVAKAKFFPTFNLTAMIGTRALDVSDLFSPVATFSEIAGSVLQPILDFGQRSAGLLAEKAQRKQALITYRQTVRRAFKSVSDALNAVEYTQDRLQAVREELESYQSILELAQTRYDAGLVTFFNVLDARRQVFETRLELATAIRNHFTAYANLYKALGGGWTRQTDSVTPDMGQTMQEWTGTSKKRGESADESTEEAADAAEIPAEDKTAT